MSFAQTTINQPGTNTVSVAELNLSDGTAGQAIVTDGNGTISFADVGIDGIVSSADATAITIDSNENVGIGISSPSSYANDDNSLAVLGQVRIQGVTNTASVPILALRDTNSGLFAPDTNTIAISTGAGERLRIDSSGDVHLRGGNQMTNALSWYNSIGPYELASIENVSHPSYNDSGGLVFKTAGLSNSGMAERMRIDSSGNVGIAAVPSGEAAAAHVVRLGDQVCIGEYDDGSNPEQFNLFHNSDSSETYIETGTASVIQQRAGEIIFKNAASGSAGAAITFSERMRIDSSGDITMSGTGSVKIPSGTTAQRPSSPTAGMARYNTTENYVEYYNGNAWLPTSQTGVVAAGGTESNVTISGIVYKLHTFTSSGTLTVSSGGEFEYLVIAGGGGGGCGTAGGGGAGGYRTNVSGQSSGGGASAEGTAELSAGSHTITIGAGGAGAITSTSDATNGGNTSIGSIVQSTGGGAGGEGNPNNTRRAGQPGGSGGGAWEYSGDTGGAGSGTAGQGYAGGAYALTGGAGGGGAGGTAGTHPTNVQNSDGGPGVSSNINGTATGRAGGGGGGLSGQSSASDGGGAGANGSATGSSGTANTGGGGGGGWAYASGNGGSGGSGLVIIRYRI
jgi:hypothetical protein